MFLSVGLVLGRFNGVLRDSLEQRVQNVTSELEGCGSLQVKLPGHEALYERLLSNRKKNKIIDSKTFSMELLL